MLKVKKTDFLQPYPSRYTQTSYLKKASAPIGLYQSGRPWIHYIYIYILLASNDWGTAYRSLKFFIVIMILRSQSGFLSVNSSCTISGLPSCIYLIEINASWKKSTTLHFFFFFLESCTSAQARVQILCELGTVIKFKFLGFLCNAPINVAS